MVWKWLKSMLSIPLTKPMTRTDFFTQWSSLLVYCLGGLTLVVAPVLWKLILQFELQGRSEGYLRLVGVGLINVGFILIIEARSSYKVPGHGAILWSVLARFVFINGFVLMMILREMIPLWFGVLFMVLDSTLATITLVIWCREESASRESFWSQICCPFLQCRGFRAGPSLSTIYILGILQLFFFLVFTIKPDIAGDVLHLDPFQGFSHGFLASFSFILSIHGLMHATNACNINPLFKSASLFYRVVLTVPVVTILFAVGQIELYLFVFLLVFDFAVFRYNVTFYNF